MKQRDIQKITYFMFICLFAFGIFFIYKQMLWDEFEADLSTHLEMAQGQVVYSLSMRIMKILLAFGGVNAIAAFYALCSGGTFYAMYLLLCEFDSLMAYEETSDGFKMLVSVATSIATPIYIPRYYEYFYKNQLPYNAWHNDTFSLMKLFGVFALIFYFRIKRSYLSDEKVKMSNYILFSLFLLLATWAKPSFLFGFAPTMAVFLLIDLIQNRSGDNVLKKVITFGMTVVPAGLVVIYQYYIQFVFGNSFGEENKVTIGVSPTFTQGDVLLKLICCYLFPIMMVIGMMGILHLVEKEIVFVWTMAICNLLICALVYEDGPRMWHGNFEWGAIMANWLLFSISMYMLGVLTERYKHVKHQIYGKKFVFGSYIVVIYQVVTGIIWLYYSWFDGKDYLI